jgi:hypothetical protein
VITSADGSNLFDVQRDVVVGFLARDRIRHIYSWAVMELMQNGLFVCINLSGKRWNKKGARGISLCNQPGTVAYYVGDNILSTTPSPCNGSMMALTSGYSAGVNAAEYLEKI